MSSQNRRQELYDRIRESSVDEVTLEEMVRHGFWTPGSPLPRLTEDLVKRRGALERELGALSKDARAYQDADRALKLIMKERMREAKERRIETKRRQIAERNARAAAWYERNQTDITHLGDAHIPAMTKRVSDVERLVTLGLPHFEGMPAIADAMGIALGELRFLAYDRAVAKVTHYARFQVPKKTGGYRVISAPMPRLKRAQYWVLDAIIDKIEPHEAAHGFRAGRSILTNAEPHAEQAVVMNYDLKDFFPSIGFTRVKGLFASFGYAEAQAVVFALLTTEAERTEVELDGQTWHVASGPRALPQGAPTSPAITNLLCRALDRRLSGAARKLGFAYTRYADDLTFSCGVDDPEAVKKLDWAVGRIIRDEGFTLNEAKTRIMRRHQHQEVTGITVNDGLTVSRQERRKFRAHLHQAGKGQAKGAFRKGTPKNSALGYAQFLEMVHGAGVAKLSKQARLIFGAPDSPPYGVNKDHFREMAAQGQAPKEGWWQPAIAPPPAVEPSPPMPPRKAQTTASNIPPVPRNRPQARAATWGRPAASEAPIRRGLRWSRLTKIFASLGIVIFLAPLPGAYFLSALAIYMIWFRQYRDKE